MELPVICTICKDEGWVCQVHETAWEGGNAKCCGAPAKPCECNESADPNFAETIVEIENNPSFLQ
jgi:hypothetical protein